MLKVIVRQSRNLYGAVWLWVLGTTLRNRMWLFVPRRRLSGDAWAEEDGGEKPCR